VPWEHAVLLDLKVCRDSPDLLVYLVCQVSRETEATLVTRDHKGTQDLLEAQASQDPLASLVLWGQRVLEGRQGPEESQV